MRTGAIHWSVEREVAAKPWVAAVTLVTLLAPQILLPQMGLRALETAQAQTVKQKVQANESRTPAPAWYQKARQVERDRTAPQRLAQRAAPKAKQTFAASKPGQQRPSARLHQPEVETSPLALRLDRSPSEKELIMAGHECGPLVPNDIADTDEKAEVLHNDLRRAGIVEGLRAQASPATPAGILLLEARTRLQRLSDANLDFGRAIDRWNRKDFKNAVQALRAHLEKYPESPWAAETMLHIADEAMFTNRYEEANQLYAQVLAGTTKARPSGAGDSKAVRKAERSYELYSKTLQKLAASEIMTGQFVSATQKAQTIFATDPDWRRRTWASHWLQRLQMFQDNPRELHTCGGNALSVLLVQWGRDEAAAQADALRPPRSAGFNLAELADVTRKAGIQTRGFRAEPRQPASLQQLASLPTPFLIHVNNVKEDAAARINAGNPGKTSGQQKSAAGAINCVLPSPSVSVKTVSIKSAAAKSDKLSCCAGHNAKTSPTPAAHGSGKAASSPAQGDGHGHFFVVLKVDGKRQKVEIINPRNNARGSFSFADLGKEWSGYGLAAYGNQKLGTAKLQGGSTPALLASSSRLHAPARVAWLSDAQMKKIVGGCYVPGPQADLGAGRNNRTVRAGGGGGKSCGEPRVEINQVSMNMFVTDTPIWYDTPIGPSVDVTISYNSQDANTVNNAFGTKWAWNYGSYLSVNPAGGVTLYAPDGRQDVYTPNGNTKFFGEAGNFDTLVKTGTYSYELQMQGGGKMIYGIPTGIASQRPVLLEVRDHRGNAVTMGYTLSGSYINLTTITDAQGKVTDLTYDANGHVTLVTDPFGRVAKFKYDENGNLIEVVDIEGHAFQYTYDDLANITELNTAQGPWAFNQKVFPASPDPDFGRNIIRITDPAQKQSSIYYDGTDHIGKYIAVDEVGNATVSRVGSVIDGKGNITETVLASGDSYRTTYSIANNLPLSFTDARGKTTHLTYNGQGQVASVTDPKGRITTFAFAANGLDRTSWQDAVGNNQDSTQYNAYHQPTQISDNTGRNTGYTYTAWGALATATNHLGQITVYNYNATTKRLSSVGRKANSTATQTTLASFTYDNVGRVREATDANSVTLKYDYNNLNAVTRVTYPDGTYSSVEYVCCGMPGLVRDRSGKKSYYDYDPLKRLTRVQDAEGQSVEYRYDAAGNLRELVDARGKITSWQYDKVNRVARKIYSDRSFQQYTYNLGLLTQMRNPRGAWTGFSYDEVDNLVGINYANSPDVTFTYDALDRVTRMTDAVGTTGWAYSNVGAVTKEGGPWNADDVEYGYDGLWRRNKLFVDNEERGQYSYDSLSRLKSLKLLVGSEPLGDPIYDTWDYSYVGNSDLLAQLVNPNGTKSVYGYDALERLTSVANKKSTNANLSSFAYGFDDMAAPQRDVRTTVDKTIGVNPTQRVSYAYDGVNQLEGEVTSEGATTLNAKTFAYDEMGNRTGSTQVTATDTTTSTYAPNRLNQYAGMTSSWNGGASSSASTIAYDASGNLSQWTTSGAGGGTGAAANTSYTYDDADRLTSVIKKNPSTLVNQSKSEFVYDGLSRLRISREYSWNGSAWVLVANSEKRRLYDGMDVVEERNASNNTMVKYTRDGNIGGILAKKSGGNYYYFHYDGSGNVVGMSDKNQASVAEYSYDAYGNTLSSSGTQAANNSYRFSTKEYIGSVGLYNYGYRFYSPGMGRWINRDPIKESGGLNLYAAFANSPTNFGDEYGEIVETVWDGANVAIGAASLGYNATHGNYGAAAIDAAGLGYDLAATAIPILPGGAGVGIKALRGGQAVAHVAQATQVAKTGAGVGVAAVRSVGQITSASSPNQMQKEVERGQAPSGIDRVDPANGKTDPQDHVHFKDGSAMHKDGGTKHKKPNGAPAKPTSKQRKWLEKHGWKCP